jgi:hypothetical protein
MIAFLGVYFYLTRLISDTLDLAGGVIFLVLIALALYVGDPKRDLLVVISGSLVGGVLEWWGTTRGVWTYVSGGTPPLIVIVAWGVVCLAVVHLARAMERKWK